MNLYLVFAVSIFLLILLISKLKVPAFYAMLMATMVYGILCGISPEMLVPTITEGFGDAISTIGVVVLLGYAIGALLEYTGAVFVIANYILKLAGREYTGLAMSLTGYVLSIPMFSDSSFVILSPIARTLSARSGIPLVVLVGCLNAGITASHAFVPPTPGPVASANILAADLGMVTVCGLFVGIFFTAVSSLWANSRFLRRKYPYVPRMEQIPAADESVRDAVNLPGRVASFACVIVPILLICLGSYGGVLLEGQHAAIKWLSFVGSPIVALSIGILCTLVLDVKRLNRHKVAKWLEASLREASGAVFTTGAAGAFGAVLSASGIGEQIGDRIVHLGLPAVFVPFLIAALFMVAQGSATVAAITTATLVVPILGTLGLHPVIATMSIAAGSVFAPHANNSHFWLVVKLSDDMSLEEGHWIMTAQCMIGSITAIVVVWLLSFIITP